MYLWVPQIQSCFRYLEHRDRASADRDQPSPWFEKGRLPVVRPMKGARTEHISWIDGDFEIEHR